MDGTVRNARMEDLSRLEEIYSYARSFMERTGNPHQWGKTHPPREQLVLDIERNRLFVVMNRGIIHGVFYLYMGEDPTYRVIYDGNWHRMQPYGTIHRIAGDGTGGILRAAVNYAGSQVRYLRIDTHADNRVMQRALESLGFERCGIIHLENGDPRIAYDLVLE